MKYKVQGQSFSKSDLELWCWDQLVYVQPWERSHLLFILQWLSRTEFIEVRTSGTTGAPKVIELSKEMMRQSAIITKDLLGLQADTSCLLCLPSQFIAGKMMIARALVNYFELNWTKPSAQPLTDIRKVPDFAAFTPMQVHNILQNDRTKFDQIKCAIIGGQRISADLEEQLKLSPCACYETYGMTETASHVAIRHINGEKTTPFFTAIPHVTFSTDDRNCLVVHSPKWFENPLVTNDIVELDDERHFKLMGRIDFVINSGGIKIYPEVVEQKLRPLLNMKYFIHKMADTQRGEAVVLYVEGVAGKTTLDENIFLKMKEILYPFEIPAAIMFVDQLEETSTSKIIRRPYSEVNSTLLRN